MAPQRKRARVSQATSPTPSAQRKTPTPAAEEPPTKSDDHALNDPWTDEEEIGLFKGLMQWKPTGIHKHFRLIALHQYLLSNGYIHPRNPHTRPAGLWRKLQTLYDLDALDERENARQLSDLSPDDSDGNDDGEEQDREDDDVDMYSEAANKIHNQEFRLPDDEFAAMKWAQRFAAEADRRNSSPPALPELIMADEAPPVRFTPSFSVEPPSEVPTPSAGRGARAPKGSAKGGAKETPSGAARAGRAKPAQATPASTTTRRSARKAGSVAPTEGSAEEAEGAEEAEESEKDEEEEGESEESTPAPRSTRMSRGRVRGAGAAAAARGKGRGRGRVK